MADENKTWTVAGTSVQRGEKSLRFANGLAADREKVLLKAGCADIRLHDLPRLMTKAEATAWLTARGDAAPVVRVTAEVKRDTRPNHRAVADMCEDRPIPHDELGRVAHASSTVSFLGWEDLSQMSRQEFSRNAAWAAGIETKRGDYPELEAWLADCGVKVNEDGTLAERRAA